MALNDFTASPPGQDEPVSFHFLFLGKADILSPGATGFASLQRPLQNIYFRHLFRSSAGVPQTLCLNPEGLSVHSNNELVEHYPYSNVAYTEYIRFEIFRENKRHFGFFLRQSDRFAKEPKGEPVFLDPSHPQHAAIFAFRHQPMVVSVLRRSHGVRILESHLFSTDSELSAVSYVQEVHHMIDTQRRRETHHLFQYKPYREEKDEKESFRTMMRHLSKSQILHKSTFRDHKSSDDVGVRSATNAEVILAPQMLSDVPVPKPRRPRLKHRIQSTDAADGEVVKSNHLSRTKSMGYLSSRVTDAFSDSDDEAELWKEDGTSRKVSRLISRFESCHVINEKPVARVKPRVVNNGELGPSRGQGLSYDLPIFGTKHATTSRGRTRDRHEVQVQRTKSAEIAEDIQRLNLSKSHDNFQKALGYYP